MAVLVFRNYRNKVIAENNKHEEGKIVSIRSFFNKTLGILNPETLFLRHSTRTHATVLTELPWLP